MLERIGRAHQTVLPKFWSVSNIKAFDGVVKQLHDA